MHLLIIGGTGRIGQLVVTEALRRGHTVTALVRDENKLEKRDGLTLVKGDPKAKPDVKVAFSTPSAPDAVLTTLAARRLTDSPFSQPSPDSPPRLMADIHVNVTSCLLSSPTPRRKLVILSMFGTADSRDGLPMLSRALFTWSPMRHQLVDHGLVDAETREASAQSKIGEGGDTINKGFDVVLVRPCMFTDGEPQEVKTWGKSGKGLGVTSKVTRASVASFMLDAVEKADWNGKGVVISN